MRFLYCSYYYLGVVSWLAGGRTTDSSGFTTSSLQLNKVADKIAKAKDNLRALETKFLMVVIVNLGRIISQNVRSWPMLTLTNIITLVLIQNKLTQFVEKI
uniref:Uncharacterized protein n=1 Tax=Roseihalotalea indica TaxID=2867963 RepID=A0AA49GKV1_9BACT|nr:hypothetical protein K4G66_30715 [Tunicatimonas sp. TK19036]